MMCLLTHATWRIKETKTRPARGSTRGRRVNPSGTRPKSTSRGIAPPTRGSPSDRGRKSRIWATAQIHRIRARAQSMRADPRAPDARIHMIHGRETSRGGSRSAKKCRNSEPIILPMSNFALPIPRYIRHTVDLQASRRSKN